MSRHINKELLSDKVAQSRIYIVKTKLIKKIHYSGLFSTKQHTRGPLMDWEKVQRDSKDGLNFVRLYFLNCTLYVNDLHNILKRRSKIFKYLR